MRAKVVTLILATALTAAGLLVVRQQRLQAVYEMTRAIDRAAQDERATWRLRADIARRITPDSLREMAKEVGPLQPIPLEVSPGPRSSAEVGGLTSLPAGAEGAL
ncbi:MAG TPA: hypothetical protein DEB06_06960 [Phycisphaerales bacterium]|nr:hypothetical protein [Phycisphaerales bacterium]